jgi:hypothetical protein
MVLLICEFALYAVDRQIQMLDKLTSHHFAVGHLLLGSWGMTLVNICLAIPGG